MKSSKEDLKKRGYVGDSEIQDYSSLKSEEAYKITIAVRILNNQLLGKTGSSKFSP